MSALPEPSSLPDDSHRFLHFLTTSIPVLLSYIGPDRRYRYANEAYAQWFGRIPADVVGRTVKEVIGADAYARVASLLDAALAGLCVTFERDMPYAGAEPRFVHISFVPDLVGGTVQGVAAVVTDITERWQAERRLEVSEEKYRSLFDHNPDAVFSFDRSGVCVSANAACADISGYTPEELVGKTFLPLLAPQDIERTLRHFSLAAQGNPQSYEVGITHKQGHRVWLEATNIPIVVGGEIVGIYGVATDITERRRAEEERRKAEAELAVVVTGAHCVLWYADVFDLPEEARLHWETRYADEAAAQRTFGVIVLPGEDFASVWHRSRVTEDRIRDDADAARHVRAGEDYTQEFRCVQSDGGLIWLREDVRVEQAAPGRWRLVGVTTDISDRKQAEAERERLLRESREGAIRQRAFLRDVLASVTDGALRLCDDTHDLPPRLDAAGESIPLSQDSGLWELRRRAEQVARAQNFPQERWYDLMTAASEAGMNAIIHAGGGQGTVCGDGQDRMQVWVEDHGAGISVEHLPRATLARGYSTAATLGHGMKMMFQMADRVFLLTGPTGTTVVLEQDCRPRRSDWPSD